MNHANTPDPLSSLSSLSSLFSDFRVHWLEAGSGEPIFFLHNGGGFAGIWEHQLAHFSASCRVIAPDWLGFGQSEEPGQPLSLDLYTRQLIQLADELGLPSFHLVGNCIGASVALNLYQQFPERVRKMVLFNPCPGSRIVTNPLMARLLFGPGQRRPWRGWMQAVFRASLRLPWVKARFPRMLFGSHYSPDSPLVAAYQAKYREEKQTRSRLELLFSVDTFTLKRFLASPPPGEDLLVIWGAANAVVPFEREAAHHLDLLRQPRCEKIDGGGHLCMYEFPDRVNELIEQHLSASS